MPSKTWSSTSAASILSRGAPTLFSVSMRSSRIVVCSALEGGGFSFNFFLRAATAAATAAIPVRDTPQRSLVASFS